MPTPKLNDLLPYVDALPAPPSPNPFDLRGQGAEVSKTVTLASAGVRYSTQLDMTTAWAYEGSVPGPTFVVDQEQTVHVRWSNAIKETLPYRVAVFPDSTPSHQNDAGAGGGVVDDQAGALTASIVVHLHGGRTAPDSDGWTENVYPAGRSMYATYGKAGLPDVEDQRAALLWYHDHAMGVTRLNVYAGLFGFWVVRDQVERDAIRAGLLPDEDHELFLLIQDRNFDADGDGKLTGAILHKTETSTAEMFGPCTLVNGVLWPTARVPARPMRVRILNGSNSRTYCLRLVEVGLDDPDTKLPTYPKDFTEPADQAPWWQVGTDGGLLDYPVRPVSFGPLPVDHYDTSDRPSPDDPLPFDRGLVLAPAERADLVIDFGLLARGISDPTRAGRKVALVNTAFAPFHGSTITYPNKFKVDGTIISETEDGSPDRTRDGTPYIPGKTPDENRIRAQNGTSQPAPAGTNDAQYRVTYPAVIRFEIGPDEADPTPSPLAGYSYGPKGEAVAPQPGGRPPLDPTFRRYVHEEGTAGGRAECVLPADHEHRWIALSEYPTGDLTLRELLAYTTDPDVAAAAPAGTPLIPIAELNGVVTWYRTAAKEFHDPARFFVKSGGCEVWKILNLTGDTHPIHVHLVQFQVLNRQRYNGAAFQTPPVTTVPPAPFTPVTPVTGPAPPDPNEQGFKDTVRVNPGEVVSIAAFFTGYCGRYMYHCHILEHEDHDMMRPFVVVAADAFALMGEAMPMTGPMPM